MKKIIQTGHSYLQQLLSSPFMTMKFCSSGISHSVEWWLFTDVAGQPNGPIFKGQAVFLEFLALDDGTDRLSQNDYQIILHNMPEDQRSHLHQGKSQKSCIHGHLSISINIIHKTYKK